MEVEEATYIKIHIGNKVLFFERDALGNWYCSQVWWEAGDE
jgi:hypothetical protein